MPPTLKYLPALEGFSSLEDGEKGKMRSIDETYIMSFLEHNRFRTGPALSRALANLTVLLRLLLFYADLPQRGTDFWRHMGTLWNVSRVGHPELHLKNLVEHYMYSRKKFLNAFGQGRSQGLLMRLVDEWSKFHDAPMAPQRVVDWDARRHEWMRLRDNFAEVLLDSRQPLRMVGVQPTITKWMKTYDDKTLRYGLGTECCGCFTCGCRTNVIVVWTSVRSSRGMLLLQS